MMDPREEAPMPTHGEPRDLIPDTATAQMLRSAVTDIDPSATERPRPKPGFREVPIDPDAPDAPVCSGRKYIVADPDAPDAPVCKPKRYIIAPDTADPQRGALPDWARDLGDELSRRFE
jgi:hypothetical protein